jgi:hypothetical protein
MIGLDDYGHGLIFPLAIEGLPTIKDRLVLFCRGA